jgi:hypothetical protein
MLDSAVYVAHPNLIPSPSRGGRRRAVRSVFIVPFLLVGRDQGWGFLSAHRRNVTSRRGAK